MRGRYLEILKLRLDLNDGKLFDLINNLQIGSEKLHERFLTKTVFYIISGYSDVTLIPLSNKHITYKQFRGARFGDFANSGARDRLLRLFLENKDSFSDSISLLDVQEENFPYGDLSFKVNALPLVPITFVLTQEDDEYPGDTRIFYDETVEHYLDMERINFLTNLTVTRLGDAVKARKNKVPNT